MTDHPEYLALLRAVLDDPGDIDARKVAMDWLEENAPDRSMPLWCRNGEQHRVGIDAALAILGEDPLRSGVSLESRAVVRCGFIEGISLYPVEFLRYARVLFSRHPIMAVTLIGVNPDARDVTSFRDGGARSYLYSWGQQWNTVVGSWRKHIADAPEPWLQDCIRLASLLTFETQTHTNTFAPIEAALAALSRGCVRWGRELAELPKLE